MFFLFLIFHVIVYLESYLLIKKKLRQKGTILLLANSLMMIINLAVLFKSVGNNYSSILYMKDIAINNPILTFLWILLNVGLYTLIFMVIKVASSKRKQTKILKNGLYVLIAFLFLVLLITIFQGASVWLVLIISLGSMYLLVKTYIKTKQISFLALIILLFIALIYSYGTYTGAARLQIVLSGYPFKAYNTGLEELRYYKEENCKKYMPTSEISTSSGDMGMIEVKNYGFIKIGSYIGY